MRSTAYIYIKEKNGVVAIDRTMPIIMNAHMSEEEWDLYCEEINKALIPANNFKFRQRIFLPVLVTNFVLLFINIALLCLVDTDFEGPYGYSFVLIQKDDVDRDVWAYIPLGLCCLSSVVILVAYTINIVRWHYSLRSIREDIRCTCKELDEQQKFLTIFLQDHLYQRKGRIIPFYIEVRESTDTKLVCLEKYSSVPAIKSDFNSLVKDFEDELEMDEA